MSNQVIRDNDQRLLEIIFQEIRKLDQHVLFNISYFPSVIRVQIQSDESVRGKVFNKLHHVHKLYGLAFAPTSFTKRDKNLISFDLKMYD